MYSSKVMVVPATGKAMRATWLGFFVLVVVVGLASQGLAATGRFIAHNTPNYVAKAKNLGSENPATVIDVSFWLNPRNQAALDTLAGQLYDPKSPKFRHF